MSTLKQKVLSGELNPIIYLPMVDSATAHQNLGYGGDFTQNGVLDTASVGATWACKASYFDGVADHLSRTSLTGVADGKQLTVSATLKNTTGGYFFNCDDGTYNGFRIDFSSGRLAIVMYNSDTSVVFNGGVNLGIPSGKTVAISFSIDMDDVNKTRFFADGVQKTITTSTFTVGGIVDFTKNNYLICKRNTVRSYYGGNIGELYFDTKYIDLATNNPFWDSVENKPIPVRKAMANLGSNPLICMPIDASNPGKNYGTGGDFTANSAPYVGARGGSEFWARSIKDIESPTNYLINSGTFVFSKMTLVFCFYAPNTSATYSLLLKTYSSQEYLLGANCGNVSGNWEVRTPTSSFSASHLNNGTFNFTVGWNYAFLSFDKTAQIGRIVFQNTTTVKSITNPTVTTTPLTITEFQINQYNGAGAMLSNLYVSTDYIDFSQETNRNLFIDQMNFPKDLSVQIEKGLIPKPLIYLPFSDSTNLGLNLGTGGTFSVVGTVTQGADVNG